MRILLPNSNFKALLWNEKQSAFIDVDTDIFENKHFAKTGENYDESVMYLKVDKVGVD